MRNGEKIILHADVVIAINNCNKIKNVFRFERTRLK